MLKRFGRSAFFALLFVGVAVAAHTAKASPVFNGASPCFAKIAGTANGVCSTPPVTPTPGPLLATPNPLPTIVATGTPGADSLTISETNYNGPFHIASSNCPTWLTYSATTVNGPTPGPVSVYANNGNQLCHIQVTDNHTGSVDIPVQITTPTPPPPTPTPIPTATPTPTPTPVPTATPANTVLWQQGAAGNLGYWSTANTDQCGGVNGTTITNGSVSYDQTGGPQIIGSALLFVLGYHYVSSSSSCGRDMVNPDPAGVAGGVHILTDGQWYTWKFHYVDGDQNGNAPGMGLDTGIDPEALIWQLHGYSETISGETSPCTSLQFVNGSYFSGSLGPGQQWAFSDCPGTPYWFGTYTPGEVDDWTIQVKLADKDLNETGETIVYRNGVKVADRLNANYWGSTSYQAFWNYGIYKWRWEQVCPSPCNSNMTKVNAYFSSMVLYSGQVAP